MGYIVLSVEDVHIMNESVEYELTDNELRTYDEDWEETAVFNFDNVVTIQPATDEEMEELEEIISHR